MGKERKSRDALSGCAVKTVPREKRAVYVPIFIRGSVSSRIPIATVALAGSLSH